MSAPTPPTSSAAFATNTVYAAGSETGNPNKVTPVSGRLADGWSPETPPSAQQMNWWFNVVYQWIAYFIAALAYYVTRTVTLACPLNMLPISGTVAYGTG